VTRLHGAALPARREAVVELWRQGRSTAVIAATLGLAVATVKSHVRDARKANPDAVPRRSWPRPLTAVQCAEIRVLKAEGRSHRAIARAVGVGHMSVLRVLRKTAMTEAASGPRPAPGTIGPQIVAMWEVGHTARAIADVFGLASVEYVYEIIRRMAPELRLTRLKERQARGQSMLQQVAALRRQKRSNREIAHELGITSAQVGHYVQRGLASGAIAPRRRIVSVVQAQEIIALNAAGGTSGREIAHRFGFDRHTVSRILRIAGVTDAVIARREQVRPRILALWEAGWKSDAIADVCGTTVNYVRRVAHQAAMKNPAFRRQARPLCAAEIERIAALRRENYYTGAEIAELIDADYDVVRRAIRKLAQSEPGLALNKRLITQNRLPEVLLLMAQGLPSAVIAERFGVGRMSMHTLLHRLRRRAKTRGGLVRPGVELQLLPEVRNTRPIR
jgi:DNA-binding CsgD family transcriptional regulator/DNA-binding MarR family transcriptional regulator